MHVDLWQIYSYTDTLNFSSPEIPNHSAQTSIGNPAVGLHVEFTQQFPSGNKVLIIVIIITRLTRATSEAIHMAVRWELL